MLGNLLFSPVTGLAFIMRQITDAVNEAQEASRRAIMADLQTLHRQLERGEIDEKRFDEQETVLLDRLESLS